MSCCWLLLLVFGSALDGAPRDAVNKYVLYGIGLSLSSFDDVENILVCNGVILHHMFSHLLDIFFKSGHIFFVSKHAHDIIPRNDTQLGEESLQHLQMCVVDSVKYDGVDILEYDMFFYQCMSFKYVIYYTAKLQ